MKDIVDVKLYIDTLGCPKNFNDSEGAAGIWELAGGRTTDDLAEADVILVNTCGFINDAKKESIDRIFEMMRFCDLREEEGTPRPLLCVSGCLSQRYSAELYEEMPEVDLLIGVNEYEELPDLIGELIESKNEQSGGGKPVKRSPYCCGAPESFTEFSARKLPENPYTATLRIAEGCNNRCAYCVIPQIRGEYRSRPMEAVVEEAERLAEAGCRELMLIAQDVTGYGRDLYGKLMLPELLRRLCRVDGIRWIRLMYCYEDKITDELIEVIAAEEKICRYIDIPLQHISDSVLRGMRRRSTGEGIRNTISRLRKAVPDIHIRTTFITGFPGETEDDFAELLEFAESAKFERLGVFAYSREEGTPAGDLPDEMQVDEEIRAQRADDIMRRQIDISREINEKKVGQCLEVIVDGRDEAGAWIGRTQYDAPEIDGTVIFESEKEFVPGDFVNVRITDAFDYDLTGVLA